MKLNAYTWVFLAGMFTSKTEVYVDYSYYLGPEYKDQYKKPVTVGTMIGNHVSWLDTMVLTKYYELGFTLKKEMRKAPFFGTFAKVVSSIFI